MALIILTGLFACHLYALYHEIQIADSTEEHH